jgi:hypothetical protein
MHTVQLGDVGVVVLVVVQVQLLGGDHGWDPALHGVPQRGEFVLETAQSSTEHFVSVGRRKVMAKKPL